MSNTIEIVVEGKNEATKVFQAVEKDATSSARKSEQAWESAANKIADGTKKASDGAKDADTALARYSDTAKKTRQSTEDLGKGAKESGDRLKGIGEASDEVDTKAMGFRDTVTGVSDTLRGMSDASLNTEQRLLYLGMGIGDLGSAGYNLLVPAMSKAKEVISEMRNPTSDLGGRMRGLGKSIVGVGAGVAIIAGVGLALDAAFGEKAANVNALSYSLGEFSKTGKASGESARVFSGNLDDLKTSLEMVNGGGVAKFIEGMYDMIPGSDLVGVSMSEAKGKISALDSSLTQLAQRSPDEARDAFSKLTQGMGLSAAEIDKLKAQLPGFSTAMDQAAKAADGSAQSQQRNTEALANYLTQLSAATDPMFNLLNSLGQVKDAQQGYTDAVKDHGIKSAEAKDASVALAEAVAGAEAAALNGQLSYSDFAAALDHWVQSGVITARQAQDIRQRVDEAHGSAQAYAGNYDANLYVNNHASEVIKRVKDDLASIPKNGATNWVVNYVQHITGQSPPSMAPGGILPLGRNAHGGPIGHAATGGGRGGLTWVGEQGPELVNLPVGSFVNPAGASSGGLRSAAQELLGRVTSGGSVFEDFSYRGMSSNLGQYNDQLAGMFGSRDLESLSESLQSFLGSGGGGGGGAGGVAGGSRSKQIQVYINLSGGDQHLLDWFKDRIRIEGGDVQTVLGVN